MLCCRRSLKDVFQLPHELIRLTSIVTIDSRNLGALSQFNSTAGLSLSSELMLSPAAQPRQRNPGPHLEKAGLQEYKEYGENFYTIFCKNSAHRR